MSQQLNSTKKQLVYSKAQPQQSLSMTSTFQQKDDLDNESPLELEKSQLDYLMTKNKLLKTNLKNYENENTVLRFENDKLRQLNTEYVKQVNQMAVDKLKKIEKVVVHAEFFQQMNIQSQLKDFVRKLTTNFSFLEKQHAHLVDHCRIMENDLKYYLIRVNEAEEIIENLKKTGNSSILELVQELKDLSLFLQIQVDELTDLNTRCKFDLAVKCEENAKLKDNIVQTNENLKEQETNIKFLQVQNNKTTQDNMEKLNDDAKLIYQLKLKSDFLEHEKRLVCQEALISQKERNMCQIKTEEMHKELEILRNTTDSFLKTNKHIFNLSSLPKMKIK